MILVTWFRDQNYRPVAGPLGCDRFRVITVTLSGASQHSASTFRGTRTAIYGKVAARTRQRLELGGQHSGPTTSTQIRISMMVRARRMKSKVSSRDKHTPAGIRGRRRHSLNVGGSFFAQELSQHTSTSIPQKLIPNCNQMLCALSPICVISVTSS